MKLAGPVVTAEVGWMMMGIVDTIMVGPLGPAAIGATGLSSSVFAVIAIFGMGLMLGLDSLVSQAHGAGQPDEGLRWLYHGVFLACAVAPFAMAVTAAAVLTIDLWGLHPDIRQLAEPYLRVVAISALPLLLYAAFRRYLQGMHVVRPIMFAVLSANLVNAFANWVLIYGNLGMSLLGVEGSAWATSISRAYMAVFLYAGIRGLQKRGGAGQVARQLLTIELPRLRRLLALGFPAASQITLEVGVFALVTAFAAQLDPISSASHQIALNVASLAFMVPLGLASASAVRVGYSVGARDARGAAHAGWTALGLGGIIMVAIGLVMFAWPEPMLRVFTSDVEVIQTGVGLLAIAAAFQLFDGTQAVATGVLRGLGDTRTPMVMNVIGHWGLGLPVGYALCFGFGQGVAGLWIGLLLGLGFVAIVLTATWARRSKLLT